MFLLQVTSYIIEMVLIILVGGFFTVFPEALIEKSQKLSKGSKKLNGIKMEKNNKNSVNNIMRIFVSILIGLFCLYLLIPYLMDFPKLLLGKFNYTSGTVYEIKRERKSLYYYVNVGGQEVKFFFDSNIDNSKKYKIGYLPKTKRAIFGEIISEEKQQVHKKIGFPFAKTLFILGFVGVFALIGRVASYLKVKLFAVSCLIFYPLSIYFYIKSGISVGTWFSFNNNGLVLLTIGAVSLLSLVLMYFGERRRDGDTILTMTYVQVIAIGKIALIIGAFLKVS